METHFQISDTFIQELDFIKNEIVFDNMKMHLI